MDDENANDILIEAVRMRPQLYNSKLRGYNSKDCRKKLWAQVADITKQPVAECRLQWCALRSSYARNLKKMQNNDYGSNKRKKSEWYLAKKLSFLNEFMNSTPRERFHLFREKKENNITKATADDNSFFPTSPIEYKNENISMEDVISIASDDSQLSQTTVSTHEGSVYNETLLKKTECEDTLAKYSNMKKCRVELSTEDQNFGIPERNIKENETSSMQVFEEIQMSPTETSFDVSQAKEEKQTFLNCPPVEYKFSRKMSPDKSRMEVSTEEGPTQIIVRSQILPKSSLAFENTPVLSSLLVSNEKDDNSKFFKSPRTEPIFVEKIPQAELCFVKDKPQIPLKDTRTELSLTSKNSPVLSSLLVSKEKVASKFSSNARTRTNLEKKIAPAEVSFSKEKDSTSQFLVSTQFESNLASSKEEESTYMFFKSILHDLSKLSDRRLRLLKQGILQDLNKYLDKEENDVA